MTRTLHCYAEGRGDDWEAICVDYDIAVQGRSFDEVRRSLEDAVALFLESVEDEEAPDRARLLQHKSPWPLRMKYHLLALQPGTLGNGGRTRRAFTLRFRGVPAHGTA